MIVVIVAVKVIATCLVGQGRGGGLDVHHLHTALRYMADLQTSTALPPWRDGCIK